MQREQIAVQVAGAVGAVLKQPLLRSAEISRERLPGWDSLKHVEILFAIEEAFGIEFSEVEFTELDTLERLVDAVHAHQARHAS